MPRKKKEPVYANKFAKYIANQKNKGLKKTNFWIPERDFERVQKYCSKLRTAYAKENN